MRCVVRCANSITEADEGLKTYEKSKKKFESQRAKAEKAHAESEQLIQSATEGVGEDFEVFLLELDDAN